MKKIACMLTALLLVLSLVLVGCSSGGQSVIKVGGEKISVNVFQLYLSRMKGQLAAAGENVSSADYWASYTSIDGETMSDYYTARVFEGLKHHAAALYMYDELGFSLPKETLDSIDEWIDGLIEEVGGGSKTMLNSVLSAYGANIEVLRDASILEAKMTQLKEHFYGKNGKLLTATAKEEFYQQTYYRGYQMLIANYYHDHEKDVDGNPIYYGKDGKIAYDTSDPTKVKATDKVDKNGDTIYRWLKEDGSMGDIAYVTEGTSIKYYYDESGAHKIAYYTDEEMKERYEVLEAIAEDCKNNEERYLEYANAHSDNGDFNKTYAPNGMYFSAGSNMGDNVFNIFATELAKLEIGELAILESDSGYYLIMRVALDDAAWSKDENSRWFSTMNTLAVEYMFQQRTAEYMQYVEVDEAVLKSVDITTVAANNYY